MLSFIWMLSNLRDGKAGSMIEVSEVVNDVVLVNHSVFLLRALVGNHSKGSPDKRVCRGRGRRHERAQ